MHKTGGSSLLVGDVPEMRSMRGFFLTPISTIRGGSLLIPAFGVGHNLLEKQNPVRIYGEEFEVRPRVEVLTGFSGHADRDGLVDFVRVMEKRPQHTFIVHGEAESAASLAQTLHAELGLEGIEMPASGQSFTL